MKRIAIALTAVCALAAGILACQDTAIQFYNMGLDAIENGDTATAVAHFEKSVMHRQDESNGLPTEHATTYVQDTSWSDEIADFVEAIAEDKPVAIGNSADALTSMQTVHGIYEADPRWRPRDQHTDASASAHRSHSRPAASSSVTERDRPKWKSPFQIDWR